MTKQMMKGFKIKHDMKNFWELLIDASANIVEEARLVINENGFNLLSVDPSGICILVVEINKRVFSIFETDREYEVGINMKDFAKYAKRIRKTDESVLSYDAYKCMLKLHCSSEGKTRTFKLSTLDTELMNEFDMTSLENLKKIKYECWAEYDLELLKEYTSDIETASEVVDIQVSSQKEEITFKGDSPSGGVKCKYTFDSLEDAYFPSDVASMYSLKYLKKALPFSKLIINNKHHMLSLLPAFFEMDIDGGGMISYYVSPQVLTSDFDEYQEHVDEVVYENEGKYVEDEGTGEDDEAFEEDYTEEEDDE